MTCAVPRKKEMKFPSGLFKSNWALEPVTIGSQFYFFKEPIKAGS